MPRPMGIESHLVINIQACLCQMVRPDFTPQTPLSQTPAAPVRKYCNVSISDRQLCATGCMVARMRVFWVPCFLLSYVHTAVAPHAHDPPLAGFRAPRSTPQRAQNAQGVPLVLCLVACCRRFPFHVCARFKNSGTPSAQVPVAHF